MDLLLASGELLGLELIGYRENWNLKHILWHYVNDICLSKLLHKIVKVGSKKHLTIVLTEEHLWKQETLLYREV